MTPGAAARAKAVLCRAWRAFALLVLDCASGIVEDEASLRASSLAFSLIFCAAPMGALLLGASTLFPKAFSFWPSLYAKIGPKVLPSALDEAAAALSAFSANAENLSLISMAMAAASALLLSMQLEKCVQACWGPPKSPSPPSNPLARHWLALTLTPCAAALLGGAAYEAVRLSPEVGAAWAPPAMLALFFLACSWALPAGRPPFWPACAAAALASAECLAIQSGFGVFWARSQSYGAIYGAAAVFLGALLWVWLFWLALLTSISVCSTALAGRARDLNASGLAFLAERLGLIPTHEASPTVAASTPSPSLPMLGLDPSLVGAAVERLSLDPSTCDRDAYEAALAGREGVDAQLEALGAAVCAKECARLLAEGLGARPLANSLAGDTIDHAPEGPEHAKTLGAPTKANHP